MKNTADVLEQEAVLLQGKHVLVGSGENTLGVKISSNKKFLVVTIGEESLLLNKEYVRTLCHLISTAVEAM